MEIGADEQKYLVDRAIAMQVMKEMFKDDSVLLPNKVEWTPELEEEFKIQLDEFVRSNEGGQLMEWFQNNIPMLKYNDICRGLEYLVEAGYKIDCFGKIMLEGQLRDMWEPARRAEAEESWLSNFVDC